MSMISSSNCCLVLQTLLESVVGMFWSFEGWGDMLMSIKGFENLLHNLVMQFHGFLQFGYSLHKLDKEHLLCVLFAFLGNE